MHYSTYNTMVGSASIEFQGQSGMVSFDYFVLGYAISNNDCAWKVDLSYRSIGDEGVEMLAV